MFFVTKSKNTGFKDVTGESLRPATLAWCDDPTRMTQTMYKSKVTPVTPFKGDGE